MPAAPAGRARCHPRRADRPCASTRRGFMLGSGALLAALLLPRARAPPATAATSALDDAAYWAFADRMQDALDPYWDGDAYRPDALDAQRERCCSPTPRRRWRATPARRGATTARGRSSTRCATGRRG